VERILARKRVLITGAGGSIGSELCRIAATFRPELLILMERSENALFEIDRQLARRFPEVPRKALLHDVVDAEQTLRHLVALKPHAIFHAAAHKHVPLMEDHPSHAVTNNLFGTKSIADAAWAVGAERFVMISSDKAVNPTSVMGATKRLAEMYVQALGEGARHHPKTGGGTTSFSMVRFGNVIGSACSVLPIWGSQLAEGGPITVTDARMTRYFMTINEAATLVIQAGAIDARAGQTPSIFVLDMGAPLKIAELAERFVRLHGYEPRERDSETARQRDREDGKAARPQDGGGKGAIDIVFTGARPGEKIHEELAYAAEALLPTPYPGIMALAGSVHADFDVAGMIADFSALRTTTDRAPVLAAIRRHVPEMAPEPAPGAQNSLNSRPIAA
jgi:FlaA1/EpsC-like NDP-sugar epimerase